ncbi:MAG TPA: WD40 repeat domain-containing protein [Gemmataceae bacterium]|nr:WD40 repeat domain-containing protein [Gemmataceae bacterium]
MATLDPAKIKSRAVYKHAATLYALAADLVNGRLYAGSDDYGIHVFDLAAEKKQAVGEWKNHENFVSALLFVSRPAGPLLISGSYDRRLIWWDPARGQPVRTVEGHQGWVRSLAATPDGRHLISAGDDMLVKIWDTLSGKLMRSLAGHAKRTPQDHVTALYAVAVSPDGKHAASGDRIGTVCVWELQTGKLTQRLDVPTVYTYDPVQRKRSIGGVRSLAFSPDGSLLAVGGIGQVGNVDGLAGSAHVELWDWRKPRQVCTLAAQGHKGIVNCLHFHPKDSWLIGGGGGSDNGFLAFWNTATLSTAMVEKKDAIPGQRIKADGHIHAFCLNAEKHELYTAGYRKLEIWAFNA